MSKYHVSVTGLELINLWSFPSFFVDARKCMVQIKQADGVVAVDGTYRTGVHHTITTWESKEAMQQYMRSGAHKEAMKNSKNYGSYVKVYGYGSDDLPTRQEALELWEQKGRIVYDTRKKVSSPSTSTGTLAWYGCTVLVALYAMTQLLPLDAAE